MLNGKHNAVYYQLTGNPASANLPAAIRRMRLHRLRIYWTAGKN